jgi:hypothetical protein
MLSAKTPSGRVPKTQETVSLGFERLERISSRRTTKHTRRRFRIALAAVIASLSPSSDAR